MDETIQKAALILKESRSVAVITGAGVSAESGIPTFRGSEGLWRNFSPEDLATPQAFRRDPLLVWEWYEWRRGIIKNAEPNAAHETLALMENDFTDFLLITQNVDGLHEKAGSSKIKEIHGNIWTARCIQCGQIFRTEEHPLPEKPVKCIRCGGLARPHILWFGESYDPEIIGSVHAFLENTDCLITAGTSGMVHIPVTLGMTARSRGARIIDINPADNEMERISEINLRGKAGEIFPLLREAYLK